MFCIQNKKRETGRENFVFFETLFRSLEKCPLCCERPLGVTREGGKPTRYTPVRGFASLVGILRGDSPRCG